MHLKRLEIKGFKSFADKIDVEFNHGITAVVGPNGSGKSNISDAIRWVLGEQSAKTLRGSKMEDVIFAGTESRKPLGFSQVAITIDNNDNILPIDFSEVTISRKLYRSGESEYAVNNTAFRLKDIQELIMDTGIGKDGYSLIGQGKIDEILSSRNEERRNLFEEAAGIVKYKTRKIESEKKLENTLTNLTRVTDIIEELENQLEPLGEQSEKAKKYLNYREELKILDINLILNGYENSKQRMEKINKDIEDQCESRDMLLLQKESSSDTMVKLKSSASETEMKYRELTDKRLMLEKTSENKNGEINLFAERYENISSDIKRIEKELEEERAGLSKSRCEYNVICTEREQAQNVCKAKEKELSLLEKEYLSLCSLLNESDSKVELLNAELIQCIRDTTELNNKINISSLSLENLNSRKASLENEKLEKEDVIKGIKQKISEFENKASDVKDRIEELNKKQEENRRILLELQRDKAQLDETRLKSIEEARSLEARSNTLKALDHEMEGYNRAVKAILNKYRDMKSVFGTVGELINVPKGLETAIETALSASIQNIVVDNENTASDMIGYLKENKLGRATFMPFTSVRGKRISVTERVKNIKGYIGIAAELIKSEVLKDNIIDNLLGRVLLCENLASAREVARATDYSQRIVTREGDVINSGGTFTGGSSAYKGSGLLSRKNEINELEEKILKIKSEAENINSKIKNVNENLVQANSSIQELLDGRNIFDKELTSLNNEIYLNNKELGSVIDRLKDIEIEGEQLALEAEKSIEVLNINRQEFKEYNIKHDSIEREIKSEQEKNKVKTSEKESLAERLTKEKVSFAEENKNLENKNSELRNKEVRLSELAESISGYEDMLLQNRNRLCEEDANIKNAREEIVRLSQQIEDVIKSIGELEEEKSKINIRIGTIEEELKKTEIAINDAVSSIHKLDITKSKLEGEVEYQCNKLWEEYEVSLADAYSYKTELESVQEAAKRLDALKGLIKELGEVNVNAIEEYKKVKERYEFLTIQRDDLETARETLLTVIEDMTEKMVAQFKEKFRIIRANFSETFKELFGGGHADLRLEDGDVLTAGIEIIVQPPGKKLQNITLLSGGEKGLAAIALLFAILKTKPTPFCILDEIEAALDDANVNRFAEFIKRYSKNTQFIVITHRKGTMAAADALYGITMEEKGVSKLLSLKLKGDA